MLLFPNEINLSFGIHACNKEKKFQSKLFYTTFNEPLLSENDIYDFRGSVICISNTRANKKV